MREKLFCGPFFHLTVSIQPVHECDRNDRQGSQAMMTTACIPYITDTPNQRGRRSRTPECQSAFFLSASLLAMTDITVFAPSNVAVVSLKLHPPNSVARKKTDGSTECLP
jgi:hypothetical protein